MTLTDLPAFDGSTLSRRDPAVMQRLAHCVSDIGFLTLTHSALPAAKVEALIESYKAFFRLPVSKKRSVDMSRTGANRGWGAPRSEQVDPSANPDYKQVFDIGFELPAGDPDLERGLAVYAPNQWPEHAPDLRPALESYVTPAMQVARDVLGALAVAVDLPASHFDGAFDRPMALLRGNHYPARPKWAGDRDFGIAPHTDYGCLTLLATDGASGLEVQRTDGTWLPVTVPPGVFVINFGEMLQIWSSGRVRATAHRVKNTTTERVSVPLFFNPSYDTNIAPFGSGDVVHAGDHLERRYRETYVHLKAS